MNYSKDDFKALFQAKFDYNKWFAMLKDFFKADELRTTAEPISDPADCDKGYYIGAINTSDSYRIGLFYYEIGHSNVARKKVGLRNLVRTFINPNWGQFDAALAVFSDGKRWRLSLISDIKGEATAAKRYTFVFGEQDNLYRTAIERFALIRSEGPSFEALKKAFSVEALTEEFFGLYKEHYERFCDFIYQNADDRRYFGPEFAQWNSNKDSQKYIRDYVKNLMGRIVFLQFLQKKGWMGVPTDRNDWVGGDPYFMQHLYDYATEEQKDDFLDEVLEPLFFNCLNVLRPNDVFDTNVKGIGVVKVPYLNGELFEKKEVDKVQSKFPKKYFHDLLNLFLQYNFTIDENDPNDAEIGVDPEMLGKIFENLLEDNKDKGAFYTPKEIVRYMCKESLISYLCSNNGVKHADSIKVLVNNHQLTPKLQEDVKTCERLNKHLRNVKVCDPAIGSGAFPMGLMNEIFACRSVLHENIEETNDETSGQIKREIIQNNIYGVDIEQGAVDIARLRFWLALVVDSVKPEPLPNLDYKIMQGNSLIESYKGLDLSNLLHSDNLFVATKAEELGKYMKSYFRATDSEEKRKLRNQIDFTVKQCIYAAGIQDTIELPNTEFFLWHTYFHDVFKEGGFDIVIGNPPYGVSIKDDYRQTVVKYLGKVPDYEIYYYFIEIAYLLLVDNGILSYIIPNSYLFNTFAKKYRLDILKKWNIVEILDCTQFPLFKKAVVRNTINIWQKNNNEKNQIGYRNTSNSKDFISLTSKPRLFMDISNLLSMNQNWGLAFKLSNQIISVTRIISSAPYTLKKFFSVSQGYIPYRKSDLIAKYGTEEGTKIVKNRLWHNENKIDDDYIQEIYGRDITKYSYSSTGEFVKYGKHLACYVDLKFFNSPRILVREITNPTIIACYIDELYVNDPQLISIINEIEDNNYSLMMIWAILNSKLATFYHFNHSPKATKGAFPKILVQDIKDFPLPAVNEETKISIESIVGRILSGKRLDPSADTTADEQEIDNLVYHLYGLTYDEVKIVDPETPITEEEYTKEG